MFETKVGSDLVNVTGTQEIPVDDDINNQWQVNIETAETGVTFQLFYLPPGGSLWKKASTEVVDPDDPDDSGGWIVPFVVDGFRIVPSDNAKVYTPLIGYSTI